MRYFRGAKGDNQRTAHGVCLLLFLLPYSGTSITSGGSSPSRNRRTESASKRESVERTNRKKPSREARSNCGMANSGWLGVGKPLSANMPSTPANDESETAAIKLALGEWAYSTPVSSSKSMLGHLIAAGGAVELVISILAMRRDVLPPTTNYETPDPACDLDYVPNQAREKKGVRHILSNSFGFGGQNITLIASRM